jgi:hypothetical protein
MYIYSQQSLTQNMWYIRATTCIFNKKLEKYFIPKIFYMNKWKGLEKD